MTDAQATMRAQAIDWAIRADDPAFDGWEALADWLAADAEHAILFDRLTGTAQQAADRLSQPEHLPAPATVLAMPARDVTHTSPRRWQVFALAASAVAAIGGGAWFAHLRTGLDGAVGTPQNTLYAVATPAGQRHAVSLPGSARIELDGDTRLTLDRHDTRTASLERGEAVFSVRHDAGRPFSVRVGAVTVTDLGTVFDIERQGAVTTILVREGQVRVDGAGGPLTLTAGRGLTLTDGATISRRLFDMPSAAIGAWRQDRLDFSDVTLDTLARRIQRETGARIAVDPGIADRRVAGSIGLDRDASGLFRRLAPLLGVTMTAGPGGWRWSEARGGATS